MSGGCPQKYVTGALAEGKIAALSAAKYIAEGSVGDISEEESAVQLSEAEKYLSHRDVRFTYEQLEEAMQTVMDSYAGGIKTNYRYNEKQLELADEKILKLIKLSDELHAEDMHELMFIYELRERLIVCRSLIAHLKARKETRWHSFAENLDYPERDDKGFNCYVNSRLVDGEIKIIKRELVREGQIYEHNDRQR